MNGLVFEIAFKTLNFALSSDVQPDMPKILFNITHGFQARMLLRSQVSEQLLAAGAELIVVSPNADEEYFQKEFSHPRITLEKMPAKFSKVELYLINLRQYFLMNPSLGATLNHKNESFKKHAPKFYWFCRVVNQFLGRFSFVRNAYMKMERWLFAGRDFDEILEKHKPDLVVSGTPGFNGADIHLLRSARRHSIPTATVMLSWDNLTSKGYMGAQPDYLLVWSDLMADEAVEYHGFPRERIFWSGAAQFDHYFQFRDSFDRHAWKVANNISPDVPLIVYGTINPGISPHETEIVLQVVDAIRANQFARRPHLWIRIHPQAVKGEYASNLDSYKAMASGDVTVEIPPVQSTSLSWDLPESDQLHLTKLLAAADIVATPSSTLAIDATCVNTPVITIGFDGPVKKEPWESVTRFANYTHYALILSTGALPIASSCEEFVTIADRLIAKPESLHDARQNVVRQQLNSLDGRAGERTAKKLLELANRT